jgi:endonuclease/exonuclease/phosphatase family metal-dependent hydrolase
VPRLFLSCVIGLSFTLLVFGHDSQVRPSAGREFRVMTLNAQAGVNSRGRYDLPRLADTIASISPSIVGLQELTRNHAVYNCDDQAALLAQRLRLITGRPWTYVYVQEWPTLKRECVDSGRGDGVETEGLALLAPEPLINVEHIALWNGRLGLAARVGSAPRVTVIVTHLASSAANLKDRIRQLATLLPWAELRGAPRMLIGDFNAEADAAELQPAMAQYRDAWADAKHAGGALGVSSGSTRPGKESRIDFVLYTPDQKMKLDSVEVIDTSSIPFGSEVSDHRPVVATFLLDEGRKGDATRAATTN